jgi:hypothetical protein
VGEVNWIPSFERELAEDMSRLRVHVAPKPDAERTDPAPDRIEPPCPTAPR